MHITGFLNLSVPPFKIHGGIKVPHLKNTSNSKCEILKDIESVLIPMQQHIGAPCIPIVKVNEHVKLGQVIANSENNFSAKIHSSVSGIVSKIDNIIMPDGSTTKAITIESDKKFELYANLKAPSIKSPKDLVNAACNCGLVGLGGAGFPTHIKLDLKNNQNIDTLIINAAECEPYITSDNRTIIENINDVIDGIKIIVKTLKIEKAIIAIETNKPEAIKILDKRINSKFSNIKVIKLESRYPQGAEKVLIKSCINRVVPIGKLPADVGCIVMNVTTIATLSKYIKTGIPLVSKCITVDGSAISNPKNIVVPIGTSIKDIIKFCGGYKSPPKKILLGGPMMGICLADDNFPILKQNNSILALDERESNLSEPSICIRCGKCIKSCPMKLTPLFLEQSVKNNDIDSLNKLNIMNCMECGCCSFICPAHRPLVQSIRLGKKILRNSKTIKKR